jgi:hypothetical protein
MDDRYCTIKFKERFYKNKKKRVFFSFFCCFCFFVVFVGFLFFLFFCFFIYFYPSTPPPLLRVDLRKNLRQRHRVCHDNSTSPS